MAALGAKPFFRTDDRPDPSKVFGALKDNCARAGVHESLIQALQDGLHRGLLNEALSTERHHDLFVR